MFENFSKNGNIEAVIFVRKLTLEVEAINVDRISHSVPSVLQITIFACWFVGLQGLSQGDIAHTEDVAKCGHEAAVGPQVDEAHTGLNSAPQQPDGLGKTVHVDFEIILDIGLGIVSRRQQCAFHHLSQFATVHKTGRKATTNGPQIFSRYFATGVFR